MREGCCPRCRLTESFQKGILYPKRPPWKLEKGSEKDSGARGCARQRLLYTSAEYLPSILLVSAVIISAAFSGAKPGKSAGGESYNAYNGNNGYESKSYEEKEREPTSDADKSENEASDVLP